MKPTYKIMFSNLGYARGIDGRLSRHIFFAHRHLYSSRASQEVSLFQLNDLIVKEDPDICCFAEIDQGSFSSAGFNQMDALISEKHTFFDIESKYGRTSRLRTQFMTKGKSLAFVAKRPFPYEKLFFDIGAKRLVYKVALDDDLTLFFAHFSLNKKVRQRQLFEAGEMMTETPGECVFLGDFNILTGVRELAPLLERGPFVLLNDEDSPTFKFYKRNLVLDLCICSEGIAERTRVKVAAQPFSDHDALIVEVGLS